MCVPTSSLVKSKSFAKLKKKKTESPRKCKLLTILTLIVETGTKVVKVRMSGLRKYIRNILFTARKINVS